MFLSQSPASEGSTSRHLEQHPLSCSSSETVGARSEQASHQDTRRDDNNHLPSRPRISDLKHLEQLCAVSALSVAASKVWTHEPMTLLKRLQFDHGRPVTGSSFEAKARKKKLGAMGTKLPCWGACDGNSTRKSSRRCPCKEMLFRG